MGMSKNFAVYFPNTEIITEVLADTWDIDNNNLLTFYATSSSKKTIVAVFNMNNILGFKEIKDGNND